MRWSDTGIILATRKNTENSLIVTVITKKHGVYKGYITFNRKKTCILQVGNVVHVTWHARLINHLGRFNFELIESIPAFFLYDYKKMLVCNVLSKTIEKTLPEREAYTYIYQKYYELLINLKRSTDWVIDYIKLELIILEELGFGLDLSKCPVSNTTSNLTFISPKTGRAIAQDVGIPYKDKLLNLPPVLHKISINQSGTLYSNNDIAKCLEVINYFLYKHCFHPYKISIPIERELLYKLYSE